MAVSNGQLANQTTFNNGLMSRTTNTSTTGQVDLENTDAASGATVENVQRELNGLNSFTGSTSGAAKDRKPAWVSNVVGTSTDDLKARAEALTTEFDPTVGHTHDGVDSAPIDATDLSNVRLRGSFVRGTNLAAVTGASLDVSAQMVGKTASTGDTSAGVVVNDAPNLVLLKDNTAASRGDLLKDENGDAIYGRLTEAAGVWTLSFYKDVAGVQTAHAFTAQEIQWWYQELFNPMTDAPIYSELASVPSDNATQDVIDATATLRGLVSATAQVFGGVKSFLAGIVAQAYLALERLDVASAATITALSSAKSFVKLTGATATSLQGVSAGVDGQTLTIHNGSSALLTVEHENAGALAADRIKLPGGVAVEVESDSSIELIYDSGQSRWVQKSGSGSGSGGGALSVTGSRAAPSAITAAGGIAFAGDDARQLWFIEGDAAHIDVTANPQVAAATTVGQELVLVGRNDAQTVKLEDGTGLSLNGEIFLGADSVLALFWDGTNWVEMYRR